jgi:hypothetical protein
MADNPLYNPDDLPEQHCRNLADHGAHTSAAGSYWCMGGPYAAPGNTNLPPTKTI